MLSGTSTNETLSIEIPRMITDPLGALVSLQSLFDTDVLNQSYESWRYTIKNHNRLYISTEKDQYILGVKNGYISFYQSEGEFPKKVNLSGKDISTVLIKFCKALERCTFCKICTIEENNGHETEFTYKFKFEDNKIVRYFLDSEYREHRGASGDL